MENNNVNYDKSSKQNNMQSPKQAKLIWIIFCKEVVDNFRDKRTLMTILASTIFGPLLLFSFLWFAEKTIKDETDSVTAEAIQLAVVGAEHAPNLMSWLEQSNFAINEAPKDYEQAVRDGDERMILKITEDYPKRFATGETAPILLIHDSSIGGLEKIGYQRLQRAIHGYGSQISSLRLQARGVSPKVIQSIRINVSDVAPAELHNAQVLTMLPYLIITFIMLGGMYLAIDTTAGERENGSLETLLIQPAKRSSIVIAKLLATMLFSSLTLIFVLMSLSLALNYFPIDSFEISLTIKKILIVFISSLPFVFLGCSLMVFLASFTKSYKEAQSYLSMMAIVPSMPLILLSFLSPEPSISNMWVPSLSQGLIIIETLKGEHIDFLLILLSMLTSSLLAMLFVFMTIKLYARERILG